jgi:regulator of sirC expression with transglutaminase-like and TPR domain
MDYESGSPKGSDSRNPAQARDLSQTTATTEHEPHAKPHATADETPLSDAERAGLVARIAAMTEQLTDRELEALVRAIEARTIPPIEARP